MNEVLTNLLERRSIRAYKKEQIKDSELDTVLMAGRYAASAGGRQSTAFVAIQNAEMIRKLSEMNAEIMGSNTDPYYGAPTIILVFADTSRNTHIEDGSCAMQNMMLAAYSIGLGSCWIHREREMFETDEGQMLKKEWGISEGYAGIGACILGYPQGEHPEAKPRKEGTVVYVK